MRCVPGTTWRQPFSRVAVVEGEPSGDAGSGLDPQVPLILVKRLSPRSGRLEVHHGLHRVGFPVEQFDELLAKTIVEHKRLARRVAPVHLHEPRVATEGIGAVAFDGPLGPGVRRVEGHVVVDEPTGFVRREETTCDGVPVPFVIGAARHEPIVKQNGPR